MTKELKYDMPNVGCLLGTAYQVESGMLNSALSDAGYDITSSDYLVLRGLYYKDGMQQCILAELLGKDKAAVSRSVSSMERKGLVKVETVSHKCRRIWLTGKGKAIEPAIMKIAEERHKALMSIANPEEMETFVRVLNMITNQKKERKNL